MLVDVTLFIWHEDTGITVRIRVSVHRTIFFRGLFTAMRLGISRIVCGRKFRRNSVENICIQFSYFSLSFLNTWHFTKKKCFRTSGDSTVSTAYVCECVYSYAKNFTFHTTHRKIRLEFFALNLVFVGEYNGAKFVLR